MRQGLQPRGGCGGGSAAFTQLLLNSSFLVNCMSSRIRLAVPAMLPTAQRAVLSNSPMAVHPC